VLTSPNPTIQGTVITFDAKTAVTGSVRIYNIKGQCIRTLVDNQTLSGLQSIRWDGNDLNGRKVSAGIYFARINSATFNAAQKIIVLK
jgi:flagellar hook assembly protein FlgD